MADSKKILQVMKENEAKFLDLRFTDPKGKLQHLTIDATAINEKTLEEGFMFDGSSIAGWKAINESDMKLIPDFSSYVMDPFTAQSTLTIFCNIMDPTTDQPYERDPRSTSKKAEAYLASTGIGDTCFVGPEAEFFIFDDVKWSVNMKESGYAIDSEEGPYNTSRHYEGGNLGHRPKVGGGYFPVPPVDSAQDLRSEFLEGLRKMGIAVEKHHHEVAPSQHELGIEKNTLLKQADAMQIYKYTVHMVAKSFGKTATFMPKPVKGDNGSGMHTHLSIWKNNKPVFAGTEYADLSESCLYFIGGIIKHGKALNAFTNASTNSYKRLIPGFEAPVILAYSARNRSAACRIPFASNAGGKRVEVRFPDASSNPYLAFSAMLMAGLDGITNKIHPGDPMDKNLYDLEPEELKGQKQVCSSLREALESLESDSTFLTTGGVFTQDQINAYMNLKWEEVYDLEHSPHPVEFQNYYSV